MRIALITAGAGRMYCGACARDLNLVRGLRARGHDAQVVPLYTPLRDESGETAPGPPIFYGGINVFLQQATALFRAVPPGLDRFLNSPGLLGFLSRFAISTDARRLGPLALSVLEGRDGNQRKELDRLLAYLAAEWRPEVVHLGNSLLSGVAAAIREQMDVPLVCTVQGEETFVERMGAPWAARIQQQLRRNAGPIHQWIAPCSSHGASMVRFLDVPAEKMTVVRTGVAWQRYAGEAAPPADPAVVGYLSAITPSKGLDLLVEAAETFLNHPSRRVVLRAAGRVVDSAYWKRICARLRERGLASRVEFPGELDLDAKIRFYQGCSLLAVPTRIVESRGVVALEAQAAGVPVVVPDQGAFPEMLALTGGGLPYRANDAAALAGQVRTLLDDPSRARAIGARGREGIRRHFSVEQMAEETERVYRRAMGEPA